jgi:hypothetical protein
LPTLPRPAPTPSVRPCAPRRPQLTSARAHQDDAVAQLQRDLSASRQEAQQAQAQQRALELDKARLEDAARMMELRLADWQQLGKERQELAKQFSQEQADMMRQASSALEGRYQQQLEALEAEVARRCAPGAPAQAPLRRLPPAGMPRAC